MQRMLWFLQPVFSEGLYIKICVSTVILFERYSRHVKLLTTLKLTTFIRPVEKLNKIEMNKWINNFKTHLRKFYITDDLVLIHNVLSKEFGVAAADIKVLIIENKREYVSSDFEKVLSKYWEHSLSKQWAGI